MTRSFSVARSSGAWPLSLLGSTLLAVVLSGCAGELPPELKDGGGGGGTDTGGIAGCATAAMLMKTRCTDMCHGATTAANFGGFDMSPAGWEKAMIGKTTPDTAPATNMCKGNNLPYLNDKTNPATGLFMDKFKATPPCGTQMPQLPPKFTAEQIDCVQKWANSIANGGNGT